MNCVNSMYNAQSHGTKSLALLQEGTSLKSDFTSLNKKDTNQSVKGQHLEANRSTTTDRLNALSTYPQRTNPKVPWLNAFLHSRSRYADFLATEETYKNAKLISSNSCNEKPFSTHASEPGAARYAQMRRMSSAELLCRSKGSAPLTFEWALDELLAADKWLHEKYSPTAAPKSAARQAAAREVVGEGGDRSGSANRNSSRNPVRAGDHNKPDVGCSNAYGVHDHTGVVRKDATDALQDVHVNDRYRARTLPRNVKDLVDGIERKRTASTCSLPEMSHSEVISRFLAAEG